MQAIHPRWSTWSFLVYASGLVALVALEGWWTYFASQWSDAGFAAGALGLFAVAAAVAAAFRRTAHPVSAGVYALLSVLAFSAFLGALWTWFGWARLSSASGFEGFHVSRLLIVLCSFAAAAVALRIFRFPLLLVPAIFTGWYFVTDFLSNGGWWSAIVTIAVGLFLLVAALVVDDGPNRAYGMWLHVGAGMLAGGAILYFLHGGSVEWALVAVAAVGYILFADVVGRASWAVLGTLGLLIASGYFALRWTHVQLLFFNGGNDTVRAWVSPLVASCTALVLLALGLRSGRRS